MRSLARMAISLAVAAVAAAVMCAGPGVASAAPLTGWVDAAGEPCAAAGAHRWLDEGVEAQSKFFYDPSTDAWYWAEADGSIARNHDAYVPLSNDVDRELWLTDDAYRRANGKWVRLGANGEMIKGEAFENGCWYYFDPVTGAMAHGFAYLPHADKWVYYDYVTGCMEHGLCYIDDAWYLLDQYTGAVTYGTVWVDAWGGYRHFEAVTGRYEGPADHIDWNAPSGGAYPSLAGQPNLNVRVSISEQLVYIRSGERVLYTMIVSTGVNGTTPLGTYYVSGRGYSFYNAGEGMGGRYWVNFLRSLYLFHTVPVDASGNYIVSEAMKLGRPASHGCVRLTIPDARFLYENLPDGTRVTIS